jgi:hypothetical protein
MCKIEGCNKAVKAAGLCSGHYERKRKGVSDEYLSMPMATRGAGTTNAQGYKEVCGLSIHRLLAVKALNRLLKGEECVHHVDNDPGNNTPSNLVICPDKAYHALLHKRARALEACGHADWLYCYVCQGYSDPTDSDLYINQYRTSQVYHRKCMAAHVKARRHAS